MTTIKEQAYNALKAAMRRAGLQAVAASDRAVSDVLAELEYADWQLRPVLDTDRPKTPDATEDGYDWPADRVPLHARDESSVLSEAQSAVYGDRQEAYGPPRANMVRTAILWHGLLLEKLADGESIAPEDVARCMVAVKLARDVHKPGRDNRVDGAGYFAVLDRLETGR